jgi:hypothetical protein
MPVEVEEGAARLVTVLFSDLHVHPSECNKWILYCLNSCTFWLQLRYYTLLSIMCVWFWSWRTYEMHSVFLVKIGCDKNPFSRSMHFSLIRLDLALHIVPWIWYLGFTLKGRRVPWLRWRTCPLASPNELWYDNQPSTSPFFWHRCQGTGNQDSI